MAAALADDAAGARAREAEEAGELAGRQLFYQRQGRRDLVDVELGGVLAVLIPSLRHTGALTFALSTESRRSDTTPT